MINEEVTKAFRSDDYEFCRGNTCATHLGLVKLLIVHGHTVCIATQDKANHTAMVRMRHCSWATMLTAGRLTAALRAFTPYARVYKKGNYLVVEYTKNNKVVFKEYLSGDEMTEVTVDVEY